MPGTVRAAGYIMVIKTVPRNYNHETNNFNYNFNYNCDNCYEENAKRETNRVI